MSRIETYFLLLVVLNLCVTAAYVLWNEQHWREEPGKRTGGRIRAAVMLLAPVIGPVFFVAGAPSIIRTVGGSGRCYFQ